MLKYEMVDFKETKEKLYSVVCKSNIAALKSFFTLDERVKNFNELIEIVIKKNSKNEGYYELKIEDKMEDRTFDETLLYFKGDELVTWKSVLTTYEKLLNVNTKVYE